MYSYLNMKHKLWRQHCGFSTDIKAVKLTNECNPKCSGNELRRPVGASNKDIKTLD